MPDELQQLGRANLSVTPLLVSWYGVCSMARPTPALLWASTPTITFSSAVMFGKRRMFWKVRPIPSRVIWNGRRDRFASGKYGTRTSSSRSTPWNRTEPAVGGRSR